MAQSAFDHWFNMYADAEYADRCRRKRKLRQRKSPGKNYQVDEDVWARYPGCNIMYVASVMAVNNYKRTCTVLFDNGLTADLSITHLRHVTLKDIQCNRYVDYGQGWSARTDIGLINIYDRYGKLQEIHFDDTSEDIDNNFFADEENNCVNDDTVDDVPSSNDITEDKACLSGSTNSIITEIFMVPIPDPEEPTAIYSRCPVWNVSSYAEAEAKAMALVNQDFEYLKAVERAKHRKETSQQHGSIHLEEVNRSQLHETSPQMEFQLTECDLQSLFTESSTLVCQSSTDLPDQQPPTENMNESEEIVLSYQQGTDPQLAEYESSIDRSLIVVLDRTNVQDPSTFKDVGTQTESSTYLSTATINPKHESIAVAYSSQPAEDVLPLAKCKRRSNTWSSKFHRQIEINIASTTTCVSDKQHKFWSNICFNNLFTCASMKFLLSILLVSMIICQLSTGSMIIEKDLNAVPLITRHMILKNIPVLIATIIPFSPILNGPSRSMLELWFYPFAVP